MAYGTSKIIYYTLFQGLYWFSSADLAVFLPWGNPVLGVRIDIFIIQKILLAFGILSILMALLSKKVSLFVFGLICCLSLWINLFITFAILPIFGN
ncbi:SpeK [Streptococcus pneumoniae]|nr:SpeK [Streptococcus pneumoniae]